MKQTILYLSVSIFCLILGMAFFLIIINRTDQLISLGFSNRTFFVLLIPMSLGSAGFLFGAMKAYAKYKGRILNGTLELGGPALIFCLVMFMGFKIVPKDKDFISKTIFLEDLDGNAISINHAELSLYLDQKIIKSNVKNQTFAKFDDIPSSYKNRKIDIEIKTNENWEFANGLNKTKINLAKNVLNLAVKLKDKCLLIEGKVKKNSVSIRDAIVKIDSLQDTTDEHGRFDIKLPTNTTLRKHKIVIEHSADEIYEEMVFPCLKNNIIILL